LLLANPAHAEDPSLPKTTADAHRIEAADALPLTKFYETPTNLAATHPGDLLRTEPATNYTLPKGAHALRILYHSQDSLNRNVAASAVILLPAGTTPTGGWPIIAWAHGTSGIARACAPSLAKDITYGEEGLMPMVRAGFAVVAPDYHGLGTAGPQEYLNKLSQARDVINAIPAARTAAPSLGQGWVVDGHSQGGRAAWGVAEAETRLHDPSYLGAVSVAGTADMHGFVASLQAPGAYAFYQDYVAFGVQAIAPKFSPAAMLTGPALQRYNDLATKGCWDYAYASFLDQKGAIPLAKGWDTQPAVKTWLEDNRLAAAPIDRPFLVIAGEADRTEPFPRVKETVQTACRNGIKLTFRPYPGLDHDPTMQLSTPDQLAWISDRFAGRPAHDTCK
jgi:pimeloyl-ACP methyl ester carboxylesterase